MTSKSNVDSNVCAGNMTYCVLLYLCIMCRVGTVVGRRKVGTRERGKPRSERAGVRPGPARVMSIVRCCYLAPSAYCYSSSATAVSLRPRTV